MKELSAPELFPGHDGGAWNPIAHTVVAQWPVGAFAENLAIDASGAIYISLHSHSRIDRYDPVTGECAPFVETPAPVSGLAFGTDGILWATGGTVGTAPGFVWRIDQRGTLSDWVSVPDAFFMNGCALLEDGRTLLVCESVTGRVLAIDVMVPSYRSWLADDRFKPGDPQTPGANGIKISGGFAYISVTDANLLYRAAIGAGGGAGELEIVANNLRADDFAFAASGALYVATHPAQTLVRLDADRMRSTVAGPDQGMVGSTACAFGRTPADAMALYVTTNGGLYRPHEGVLQDAKLVRLEVGEPGAPLAGA
ncbi:Sugar lactone lactonase YvrE [Sphingomonas antarctica]|uniref:SMP-30/gluconolactonase/LRE family protein n=1 Tax=Sphingomonas antarctica TaxID=2040274 RepID=UPI0039E8EA4E